MATLRPGPPDARAGGINSGRRYEDRREAEGGRCPGCCPESPISRPYKGKTKRTAKNGCPTKPTWDHGTKFRLLPGISDISPLQRERRRGQPGMAVPLKPTWDHEEDSQEWLSYQNLRITAEAKTRGTNRLLGRIIWQG